MNPPAAGVTVTFIRPDNTTAYTAGDAVGASGLNGAVLAFEDIANWMNPGREVCIISARLRIDIDAVPVGMDKFRLHLYNVTPDSLWADNGAWDLASASDRAGYLGFIEFATPADLGSTLFVQLDNIQHQVSMPPPSSTSPNNTLYAILQTIGAWTPAALTVFAVTLNTEAK